MSRLFSAIRRARRRGMGDSGEAALSFGLILPLLMVLTLGIIEMGLLMLDQGRAAEATRRGSRLAAMENAIANLDGIAAPIECRSTAGTVTCTGAAVLTVATFDGIVASMQAILPRVTAQNVLVTYRPSALGTQASGGIKPFVTVSLSNYRHPFSMLGALPGMPDEITFDDFATTQLLNGFIAP